jgi:hypothetical protein
MTDAIPPPWKSLLAQPDPDAHVVQLYQGFVRDTCICHAWHITLGCYRECSGESVPRWAHTRP